MSSSYNNVLLTTLDENYMFFTTGDGISIQLISLSWLKEICEKKIPKTGLLFTYLQTQTNNLERQYESHNSLDSAMKVFHTPKGRL